MGRNKKKKSESKQNIQEYTEDSVNSKSKPNDLDDDDIKLEKSCEISDTTMKRPPDSENFDIEDEKLEESCETSGKMKRPHDSENSDVEDGPKKPKKKKKKAAVVTDETAKGKKNKISKRQIKKEKHAARLAQEQANVKDQTKSQCLNYLSQWKYDKQNWKFMKARQVWLHKNKFSIEIIPEASWPLLLEYFESAQGNIKTILLNDANKIIKQMDEWTESQTNEDTECDKEKSESIEQIKPDEIVYQRARSLIQCLHE